MPQASFSSFVHRTENDKHKALSRIKCSHLIHSWECFTPHLRAGLMLFSGIGRTAFFCPRYQECSGRGQIKGKSQTQMKSWEREYIAGVSPAEEMDVGKNFPIKQELPL